MLRGINVSGSNIIKMVDLKKMFQETGMKNVSTYIQSGNVIFDAPESGKCDLAGTLEHSIRNTFGISVHVILRDVQDLEMALSGVPADFRDESKIYFMFFKEKINAEIAGEKLDSAGSEDLIRIFPGHAALYCFNGYGKTKLSNNYLERMLKVTATTRNFRTVSKLIGIANK